MSLLFFVLLVYSFPLHEAVALSIGNFSLLAVLFYAHIALTDRYWERQRYLYFFVFSLTLFGIVCGLRYWLHIVLLKKYLMSEGILVVSPERRLTIFVLITSFVFALVSVLFRLLVNRYRRERDNMVLLAEKQAAELQLLKAQINPHFLFNALNNVYSLVVSQSAQAAPMLVRLSALLRYVLYESQQAQAALPRELAEIQNFIDLYRVQQPETVDIAFTMQGNPEGLGVEPMLLLPLVENCFKHSDLGQNPQAFCRISAKVHPGHLLEFTTENSFQPRDRQKDQVGGVGLENMRRRLQLQYGHAYTFTQHIQDQCFTIHLRVPCAHLVASASHS